MNLFNITEFSSNNEYCINVQVNYIGIKSAFNHFFANHFYTCFIRSIKANTKDFCDSNYHTDDKLFIFDNALSSQFQLSTANKNLHKDFLNILQRIKNSSENILDEVKDLYSKDGSVMTNYLTKYISHHCLQFELNNNNLNNKKKLKI